MATFIRLLGYLRKHWRLALLAYLSMLAATAFSLAVPKLTGQAIDLVLAQRQYRLILILAGVIVGVSLFRALFSYTQSFWSEVISQRLAYDMRNALYDHLQRLSFSFYDRAQTGQLMSRATADVESVRLFVGFGLLRSVYIALLILFIFALLVSLNWRLALTSLAFFPFIGLTATRTGAMLRVLWLRMQEGIATLGATLQENLSGIRIVKAFGRQGYEEGKYGRQAEVLYQYNVEAGRVQAVNSPLMGLLLTMAIAVVLGYGGWEVMGGRLTPGALTQFLLYLLMLAMPVRMLGFIIGLFSRALSSARRVFEVLDTPAAIADSSGAREVNKAAGLVRFEGVSFSYDSALPVLKNVSFEVKPGEAVALVGPTGSGKTTIAHLLPRFYDVSSGRITIDGVDIRDISLASLRRLVGVVQQDIFLFSASIRDNIAYGSMNASQEEIIRAAKLARLHDFIASLPQGYDTWVGERGITLSGGQRQRLAIARTLLMDPPILILDDSTSSVDIETEALLQEALGEVMKGRTTLIIAQRLASLKRAHRILVLKDGEIAEEGSHEELVARGGLYKELYELQFQGQEGARA